LVKEIEELKVEVRELKNKNNRSEYENYYLDRQESDLRNMQSKLGQLRNVISNSNSNSSDFPIGWVVSGMGIVVLITAAALIIRKKRIKK